MTQPPTMSEKTMSAKDYMINEQLKRGYPQDEAVGYAESHDFERELMEAYHAHELVAIRKAVDGLVTDTMKKMQKAKKDSIESTVFAARALAFGDIQNILDAHKPKP